MPAKTYDPEKNFETPDHQKDLDVASERELRKLEDKYSTPEDEAEDRAIEGGTDPDDLERHGMGRKLRLRDEEEEAEKDQEFQDKLSEGLQNAKDEDARNEDSLYTKGEEQSRFSNISGKFKRNKKVVIAGGAGVGVLVTMLFGLFGFLGVFKLDHLMSNIEAKSFARLNADADGRSDKWIRSYIMLRLTRLEGVSGADPDSEFFRANRVDTNNPVRDFYRTLLSSNFEADLAKQGVAFVNVDSGNGPRFVQLHIDGKYYAGLDAGDIRDGNLLAKLNARPMAGDIQNKIDINLREPGGNKKARQAIKDATRHHNVFMRRTVRKAIANQTGVKNWRFFEKTRDRIDNKKIDIRNKIVSKVFPANGGAVAKYMNCLLGVSACRGSSDQGNPSNRSTAGEIGSANFCEGGSNRCEEVEYDVYEQGQQDNPNAPRAVDSEGNPVSTSDKSTSVRLAQATRAIMGPARYAGGFIAFIGILELFDTLDQTLSSGGLSKMVGQARGIQALSLWQTMVTSRDQIKSGELTGEELNQFMQVINNSANSEGWSYVVEGNIPTAPELERMSPEREAYCSDVNQDFILNPANEREANKQFHYLCPKYQIGSNSNAKKIEDAYNKYLGGPVGLGIGAWRAIKGAGGGFIGALVGGFFKLADRIAGAAAKAVVGFMEAMGAGNAFKKIGVAVSMLVQKVLGFLGAGPMITGDEPAGVLFNVMLQGGVFAAESTARERGAAATNDASRDTAIKNHLKYEDERLASLSLFDRYLSTNESQSVASRSLFAVSNFKLSSANSYLKSGFANIYSVISGLFQPNARAAAFDAYAGTKFADIQSYDYPPECFALDPLNVDPGVPAYTPLNGTNLDEVMARYGVPITPAELGVSAEQQWETVNDPIKFYDLMYSKINSIGGRPIGANPFGENPNKSVSDNTDAVALQIYNCHLLDSSVRGSLAAIYGYDKDYGYPENVSPTGTTAQQAVTQGSSIYIIGDSLTVGMINSGNLEQKLTDNGWVVTGKQAAVGDTVGSAITKMDSDRSGISNSSTVLVALGTNHVGASSATFSAEIQRMVAKIKSLNSNAQIVWVNAYTRTNNNYGGVNGAITSQSSALGYKVINWASEAQTNASRYPFAGDGIHHTASGYDAKASFIAGQLGGGGSAAGGGGAQTQGNAQQLAQQILANSNITYPLDASSPNGDTRAVLQALARGEQAPVDCLGASPGNRTTTSINVGILQFILELGAQGRVGVNAITDKCHSANSPHYRGIAVDFECNAVPFNTTRADPIAAKYGGARNAETCSGDSHWHYDF